MTYKEVIDNIQPIDYSQYKDITSYEKLMLYAAQYLLDKSVPLTFNYITIASYKLFPDKFCCDNELKEFPSVDRLNRTMMHLKYVKKGRPFLAGSQKIGYTLTKLGASYAEEVARIISSTKKDVSIPKPIIDAHKKGFTHDYEKFINSKRYKDYLENGSIDAMHIWEFFGVIPYTETKRIKKELLDINQYAKSMNDEKCIKYIEQLIKEL